MEQAGIGWIAAIIIGGVAGWLAERFMKSDMGVLMNVLLGIVGRPWQTFCSGSSAFRSVAGSVI